MVQVPPNRKCINCETCTYKAPLFSLLSQSELEIMNRDRYSIKFKAGETILKQGTTGTHIISMIEGMVKVYLEGYNNRKLILSIVKPWQFLGGPGVHTDNKNHYSVTALVDSLVCFIDRNNFNKVLLRNPKFSFAFIEYLSHKSINQFNKLISLTQKQMPGRLADALLYLSNVVYEDTTFNLHLSRQDLADLSSMSKDSAIRILKEFETDGIINLKGKNVGINSLDKLKEISLLG